MRLLTTDCPCQLIDTKSLSIIKTYQTQTPLNSAALHPTRPYVILGGGQEAMNVTTTSARQGKFEARFWHKVFEEEVRTASNVCQVFLLTSHPSISSSYVRRSRHCLGESCVHLFGRPALY